MRDYWSHKQDFMRTVIDMERLGVGVDLNLCRRMEKSGIGIMDECVELLGGRNPGSPKDLYTILIEELGLPVVKKTKNGNPSFDKDAMEIYEQILERRKDSTSELILTYRGWQKAVSSNYVAYQKLISPDGRLRPNYKFHGTKTGRMSCEKPNLQQIPKSSEKPWNGQMKKCFIPASGFVLVEADYSQLELRLGTAYAKEEALMQVFLEGRDIFTEMSEELGFSRQDTKTLVYTIQYGGGVKRISQVFGVDERRAYEIRKHYYATYPKFKILSDYAQQKCLTEKSVGLWTGRRRHFQYPKNEAHKALNSVIQGGAADIVEHTMVRLHNEVHSDDCRMLLQVHDSVVFEIREDKEDCYKSLIKEVMEDVKPNFGVKFAVEVESGKFGE